MQLAIEAYQQAISIEPIFVNSYINLADLQRSQQQEKRAFETLMKGIKAQPNAGILPYSAGLSLFRQNQPKRAVALFKQATDVEGDNPQYWLVYGLALEKYDVLKATDALQQAYLLSKNPEHLFARCDMLVKYKAKGAQSCIEALKAFAPANVIQQLRERMQ